MNGIELPEQYVRHIQDLRAGVVTAVPARPAATVVLLRDHPAGMQTFLMRRASSMSFAAGAYVFPGGSVDPRDGETTVGWAGDPPALWAGPLRAGEALARELVCAAVRETFEEALVLLAGRTPDSVVGDTAGADWEADRQRLLDRTDSLAEFLQRRQLVLRSDLLRAWAQWTTPDIETRRYDTRFFVAAMPEGQHAGDVSTEADRVEWARPDEVVDHARARRWHLLPPTLATLGELAQYDRVADVLAAHREMVYVQPVGEIVNGKAYLVYPK